MYIVAFIEFSNKKIKKMKKIIYFKYLFCSMALLGLLAGCNEGELGVKPEGNGISIVPSSPSTIIESKTVVSYAADYTYPVAVAVIAPVAADANVTITLDNSRVAAYNTANNKTYATMPEGSCSLESTSLTIPKDGIASQQTNLVVKPGMLEPDTDYLLPVSVASVSVSDIIIDPAMATKYYIFRAPLVPVFNLSDKKPAKFDPTVTGGNPARGNDGILDNVCESGTTVSAAHYWEVDLARISPQIRGVKIYNSASGIQDNTKDFYVFISDVKFTGTTVAESLAQPGVKAFFTAGNAGRPTTITPMVSGRYIRLQNTGTTSLTLAELTVTGVR
jgi:hypothetical protein